MAITSINSGNDTHANYINSGEKQQGGDDTFDKIKTEVIQNLRSLKIKKPELYENIENCCSLQDLVNNINSYLNENKSKSECRSFIDLIRQNNHSKLNEKYEIKEVHDHFYPMAQNNKDDGKVKLVNESNNPFDVPTPKVEELLELYRIDVIGKYKGRKAIELEGDVCTIEDFCHEISKVYGRITSHLNSNLKPILIDFAKRDDVRNVIGTQKKNSFFYQIIDKEHQVINERDNEFSTKDNIHYFQSRPTVARAEPILLKPGELTAPIVPNQRQVVVRPSEAHGNPFLAPEPKIEQLINLYNEKVVNAYNGKKDITLAESIDTIEHFCQEVNRIKNSTSQSPQSSRFNLLVDFFKNKEVEDLFEKMNGYPEDFYVKGSEVTCDNGLLLQKILNEYVNGPDKNKSLLQPEHYKKIKSDLGNLTPRSTASIELESNGNIIVRNFPESNEKIALMLTELLKKHKSNGSFSEKIAEYLKVSRLGAHMQLQPLLNGDNVHVALNQDTEESIRDKITHLSDLMDFIGKHLKYINTQLNDFPALPAKGTSLKELQEYYFDQALAFDMHPSLYTEPQGMFISAKRWLNVKWGNIIGNVTAKTYLGGENDKPIDTIRKLREILNRNLNNQNYEKTALNNYKYQVINEGLNRIEKQAATLDYLISNRLLSVDMAKKVTFAFCYSVASECVDLKQQSKSINFNKFLTRVKVIAPLAAVLSVGILVAGVGGATLAPILAIGICCIGIFYLFIKCKPKLEKSEMSKQLTDAMSGLVYQKDFYLDSHDVSWGEAWKYRKGAIKSWWSGEQAAAPTLSEPSNSALIHNTD
ncbi:Permease of the major facilitator superfamily [Yersinia frederiksenii]|uniref:MFS transporter permease n=1 Tax=Yersinia frederiksenii TaxID=29484 RepID=UPI0005E7C8A5|nr:Permease of the major facilitator superfamily [Yersinia frederiksenii]